MTLYRIKQVCLSFSGSFLKFSDCFFRRWCIKGQYCTSSQTSRCWNYPKMTDKVVSSQCRSLLAWLIVGSSSRARIHACVLTIWIDLWKHVHNRVYSHENFFISKYVFNSNPLHIVKCFWSGRCEIYNHHIQLSTNIMDMNQTVMQLSGLQ